MRILTTCLVALFALVFTTHSATAGRWDSKGWVKLGERTVNGKVDKDRITVNKYEGRFTKLTLVVEDSDIELLDFDVTFGNNETWNPKVRHYFKEGARSRVIDLPGDQRIIKHIDLKYKNLPNGGRAKVEVWGWKSSDVPKPAPFSWNNAGWQMLGERTVNGKIDKDRISVGKYKGKFEKLTIVVLDSDLELLDFEVKFEKGQPWHPSVRHVFKELARTHQIDFPGDERQLRYIDLKYKNLPGGGNARVQVWAK